MATREHWTRVLVDTEQCFIYGPRFGRLYLLSNQQANDSVLLRVIGLRANSLLDSLPDSVAQITYNLSDLKAQRMIAAPTALCITYRLLNYSRHFIPFRLMTIIVSKIASLRKPDASSTISSIGNLLHDIEHRVGIADCYPRALMAAYLCLRADLKCELFIGVLSPTRMMHAWCSTNGQLPYEALPEHYMYQPLISWRLTL